MEKREGEGGVKYPGLPLDIRDTRAEAKERQDAERSEREDPAYLAWLRKQPCIVTDDRHRGRIESHHFPKRSTPAWRDELACSLCAKHHAEFHTIGQRSFDNRHGLSVVEKIQEQRAKYEKENTDGKP